jgi:hypothetical protein
LASVTLYLSTNFLVESGEENRAAVVIGCGMSKGSGWRGPSDTLHLSEHLGRLTGVQLQVLFSKSDGEKRRESARIGCNNMQNTQ